MRRRPEMPGRLEPHAATSCSGWSTSNRHPPRRLGPAAAAASERDLTTRPADRPAEQSCRSTASVYVCQQQLRRRNVSVVEEFTVAGAGCCAATAEI